MGMKEQIAEAEKTLALIDGADRGNAAGSPTATPPTAPQGAAAGDGTQTTRTPGANTPPGTAAGNVPTASPTAGPQGGTDEVARLRADLESRERQLRSQAGTHGQKMKELTDQVRQMGAQITELVDENRRLREQATRTPAPQASGPQGAPPKGTEGYRAWLKAEVLDELGEHTAAALASSIEERMRPMEAKLSELDAERQRIAQEREQLTQREAKRSAVDSFWNEVEKLAPGARMLNGDPDEGIPGDDQFIAFLDTVDPDTGLKWRDRAVMARDAKRFDLVAAVFNAFFKTRRDAPKKKPDDLIEPQGATGREPPTDSGGRPPVARMTREEFERKMAELRRRTIREPGNIAAITAESNALIAAYGGG